MRPCDIDKAPIARQRGGMANDEANGRMKLRLTVARIMRTLALSAFALVALTSALALAAVVGLWVHSYSVVEDVDKFRAADPPRPVTDERLRLIAPKAARMVYTFRLRFGGLGVIVDRSFNGQLYPAEAPTPNGTYWKSRPARNATGAYDPVCPTRLGFGYCHSVTRLEDLFDMSWPDGRRMPASVLSKLPPLSETSCLEIRCWLPAALCAVAPALWTWMFLRSWRHKPGCCPGCGYDLRASADRCPECGLAVARAPGRGCPEHGNPLPAPGGPVQRRAGGLGMAVPAPRAVEGGRRPPPWN